MDELILVMGFLGGLFALLMACYYFYGFVYFLIPSATSKEFRRIKKEFKDGCAYVYFGKRGPACHTECNIRYSNGELRTRLDPVSSPFGVYKHRGLIGNSESINMNRLAKKTHDYFHDKIGE